MVERLEAVVSGRVQGVGFRFFVEAHALLHSVKGYVKNLPGGDVEVVAEGGREKLEEFLHALEKGPPTAKVADVKKNWYAARGDFKGFSIKY